MLSYAGQPTRHTWVTSTKILWRNEISQTGGIIMDKDGYKQWDQIDATNNTPLPQVTVDGLYTNYHHNKQRKI